MHQIQIEKDIKIHKTESEHKNKLNNETLISLFNTTI